MNDNEKKQLADLIRWKSQLEASHSIPLNVDQAFRTRLSTPVLATSTKVATSENKAVNEAGAATYSVMDKPDGFLQVIVKNATYYLPYFS